MNFGDGILHTHFYWIRFTCHFLFHPSLTYSICNVHETSAPPDQMFYHDVPRQTNPYIQGYTPLTDPHIDKLRWISPKVGELPEFHLYIYIV